MIMQPDTDPLSKRDYSMLDRAFYIAQTSTERHKHGAVLYKSGRVLSVGINAHRNKHPTMEIEFADYTRHAEIHALRATGYGLGIVGATLYVVRANVRLGTFMFSKPCAPCEQALKANGIKRVVYSV